LHNEGNVYGFRLSKMQRHTYKFTIDYGFIPNVTFTKKNMLIHCVYWSSSVGIRRWPKSYRATARFV